MHRGECREFSKIFSGRKEELVGSFVKLDADAMGEQRGWGRGMRRPGSVARNFEASVDCRNERLARRKRRAEKKRKKRKVIRGTSLPTRATHRRIVCRSRACNYK